MQVKVLLYTEQPILAIGLAASLPEGWELSGSCDSLPELMGRIDNESPDLVLIELTRKTNFDALGVLQVRAPRNIVLWIEQISPELAWQALASGVRGILRRSLPTATQMAALKKIIAGELWYERHLTHVFLNARRVTVTQREGQLIRLLSEGRKNKEIATMLGITEGTVKVYFSHLFRKIGCKDRHELSVWGLRNLGELGGGDFAEHVPRSLVVANESHA